VREGDRSYPAATKLVLSKSLDAEAEYVRPFEVQVHCDDIDLASRRNRSIG
jgi:hypothetical protein